MNLHRFDNPSRRGVAMLLVLVSLAMGTIITIAYLASRDNSTMIGENVSEAATARNAAITGIELGVAVLETDTDWRTAHDHGLLLNQYAIAGAYVDLELVDLLTGAPPDETTRYVEMTATATVSGVQQAARALAEVPPDGPGRILDLDLSEFAVFASENIAFGDSATITRWPAAPMSVLGETIALGTQGTLAGTVEITGDAAAIDSMVYAPPMASASLITNDGLVAVGRTDLTDTIPMPAPPDPGVAEPDAGTPYADYPQVGGTVDLVTDERVNSADLSGGATWRWSGDVVVVSENDFQIRDGSRVLVEDHATLVVFGQLTLNLGSIELAEGATLTLYLGGLVDINDGYIGDAADVADPFPSDGSAGWIDPERVRIYPIASAGEIGTWNVSGNSVLKASIYAPSVTEFTIQHTSALYGRVAAKSINVINSASIFYDHYLARDDGYTDLDSAIYDADGYIKDEYKLLSSFNDADVTAAAVSDGSAVSVGGTVYNQQPDGADAVTLAGQPTPRTIVITYEITSFGTDLDSLEARASGEGAVAPAKTPATVELELRDLEAYVLSLDVLLFQGVDNTERDSNRSTLAFRFSFTADKVALADYPTAISALDMIYSNIDGTGFEVMIDCSERVTLADATLQAKADIQKF
jgi:hypothetical protein